MPASTPARIYLDHNATTPVFPEVVEAMRACWSEPYLNPASQHEFGRRARRILEDARDRIAELLGANTSGTARPRHLHQRRHRIQQPGNPRPPPRASGHRPRPTKR